ncbi:MAG TPA: hypothetical protein VHM91_08760, partial [Verrucomicrobiales bacterium]|nr:hypothetical protein [Verrucomicrobiales bacterium]
AAAPSNDSFASRAELNLSGATGTNAEATIEAGEPRQLPGVMPSGTVWWTFTPAVSGWYEISTAGSAVDTVLNVYRGSSLSSLSGVAAADDDALDDSVSTSRVRFQATGGEPYAIQAGSFNNTAGAIVLAVQPVAEPQERVTALSLSPAAPFEVSTAEQVVTITFSLKQNAALDYGTLFVTRPDGGMLREQEFTAAQRISGTASEGTYQLSVTLPRYAAGGNYPLWITAYSVNPADAGLAGGGWVWTSLPSAVAPYFTVSNSGSADVSAPVLASAVLPQSSVDVTGAGVVVPLTLQITDNLSGFASASVLLEQTVNAEQTDVLAAGTVGPANRTSGTAVDGQYQVQFFVPQDAPAGTWKLRCELTDTLGNRNSVLSSAVLTVTKNPYPAWATAQGLTGVDALPDADPDQDGQSNLQEFAFHTDPKHADLKQISPSVPERVYRFKGAVPLQYSSGGELRLRYLRRRGDNAGATTTVPQFGNGLTDWTAAVDLTVTPFSADWEMVEARDPAGAATRRFGRVLVTLP